MPLQANLFVAFLVLGSCFLTPVAHTQQREAVEVGDFIGLPIIGDEDSGVAEVTDVLISYDGRISAFIATLSGRDSEGERVRVPWSDVTVQLDPLQVELTETAGDFVPYPEPPAGTLGDIDGALATLVIGAPAKTRLGERVGEVLGLSATSEGRVIGATISRGDTPMPLPWSFVEIRPERPITAVASDVEPVVIIDRN